MTNVNESSTPKSRLPADDNADRKPPPTREQRELAQAKARTGGSRLAEVAALLRGEEGAGPDDQDDGDLGGDQGGPDDQGAPAPRNGKAPKQPKSLLELSKAVGVPVEELYNLEIPLRVANGDKKTITLADLKDYRDRPAGRPPAGPHSLVGRARARTCGHCPQPRGAGGAFANGPGRQVEAGSIE
jgi:hypothetical protein